MTTTFLTFDKRSGQILSVHHGAIDVNDARTVAQYHNANVSDEYIDTISISSDTLDKEKLYKVDAGRKVLVAATVHEGGIAFEFGGADGSSSRRSQT